MTPKRQSSCHLRVFILAFAISAAIFTFLLTSVPTDPVQTITRATVGGHDLYIPGGYMRGSTSRVGGESGLIDAYYPGGAPLLKSPDELWEARKWDKRISILFEDIHIPANYDPDRDPAKALQAKIDFSKAYKNAGEQYGLIFQTQPDGVKNDLFELWVDRDGDKLTSFIECSKKYTPTVIPQCQHFFHDERFRYEVLYDKRLLPEWRLIEQNVLALIQSFNSETSAKAFVSKQIPIAREQQIGEKQ